MTILLTQTRKSAKRWWPKPSTKLLPAPTGHSAPSSLPGTIPRATTTTCNRPFVDSGRTCPLITNGPRVPLLVISPYAKTNYVSHDQGSQSSVVKFVDIEFNLIRLALLPDEIKGRVLGEREFGQADLGPEDLFVQGISDLTDAFSPSRLTGAAAPLPPSYVMVPESNITNLPPTWSSGGCKSLDITTTDRKQGITNVIPSDFNPRPKTNPN